MCGCSRRATVCASRKKRSATTDDGASSTSRTFTATSRFKTLSRARNTAAKPPSPSRGPTVNSCPSACCRRCWRAARSMAVQKARIGGRVLLGSSALLFVWLLAVWPPPIWWRDHEPRCTAMMRLHDACRTTRQPARAVSPAPSVPPVVERMVIIAEDSRFKTHHGIDFIELHDAWAAGGHRGASTITQQLAKNLYLSPSRSIFRKLKEGVTAVRLELALSKNRIMGLYLNTAEWGPGVWGAAAASPTYFGVSPARLTEAQAAALAATLPQPRTSNPAFRPARMLARRDLVLARYYGGNVPVPYAEIDEDSILNAILSVPVIEPPILPPILDSIALPDTATTRKDSTRSDSTRSDTTRSSVHQP